MRIVMLYNFFGLLIVILAGIVRFRIKGDLGVEQKEEGDEENKEELKEEGKEEEINKENNEENKEILIEKET